MRFALRSLLKHPGSTGLAVVSLAAGLGLVTALASLADAILFHPLPVAKASEIVRLYTLSKGQPLGFVSYPDFDDFRRAARSVSGLIAQSQVLVALGDAGAPARVRMGLAVTPDYFDVLGVAPAVGRAFSASESREPVVMLAYEFWESHREVVGRTILLGGSAFTVIGVAPKGFGLDRFAHEDFYVPMGAVSECLRAAQARVDFAAG
jgi:putative ABC transport system permease protein